MIDLSSFFNLNSSLGIAGYSFTVILFCWVLSRISRAIVIFFLRKRLTKEKFGVTRLKFTRNSLRFIFGLLGFLIIIFTVPIFRKQAGYIFSGAGILAAIVGFAAKDAISNLIGGLFIVLFRPFRVGDYIKLNDERMGIVDDITLRHTIITTFENTRLIIPNSVISTESVVNFTIHETKILSFNNFSIGLYSDIDLAKNIIKDEIAKLDFVIDNRTPEEILNGKPEFDVRLVDISESAILIRAYIWLSDPLKEFQMKSYLKESVHKKFIEKNIALPIPMRKIVD